MARLTRGIRYALAALAVLAVLVVVAVVVFTRTDFGVERAGQFALDQVRGGINGELTVGRVESGGLFRGAMLHDVRITDPTGRPFLHADSARLAYRIRTLLGGDIAFDRLILHGPDVVIEKLPGSEKWNYQLLFPGDTTARPDTASTRSLVLIEDVTVVDGRAVVRMPWEPDEPVAVEDTASLILEEVAGGIVRVMRFEDIDGRLPEVVWETPEEEGRLIRVGELAARVYAWETPIDVQRVEGTLTIRDSLVSFDAPVVRLPSSRASMVGTIIVGDPNRYDIEVESDDLAFADLAWIPLPLPDEGGGSLRFRMQSQERENMLWLIRDADVRSGGSELAGSFGVVTGDTLYFTNVDLRASPLDVQLLRRILPEDLPLEGLLIGTVEVEGPISALRTRGNVRYRRPAESGRGVTESEARWAGTLGLRPPYTVRGLRADIRRLELEHVARWAPELRLRGVASGRVEADGSLARGLRVRGAAGLERDGLVSTVRGGGELAVSDARSRFDLRLDAVPVALELLGEQFPAAARITGAAEGPVTVTGSLEDLRVDVDLRTPAGGVALDGQFALVGPRPRYRASGAVTDFRLDRVMEDLPETVVSGRFEFDAAGGALETLEGPVALDVDAARVAGVDVYRGAFRGALDGGVLRVDSLKVATEVGDASATGAFGLVEGRTGELAVTVRADSLSLLEPLVFPGTGTPELALEAEPRLAGVVSATGTLSGSLLAWGARGTVDGRGLVYDDADLRRAHATFDWRPDGLTAEASIDSLRAEGRFLRHAGATIRYAHGAGTGSVRALGVGSQALEADGSFALADGRTEVQLDSLALATRDGRWRLQAPTALEVARTGVRVHELVAIRDPDYARLRIDGDLPWRADDDGPTQRADMAVELDSVRLGELLRVAQSDSTVDGVVTGRFRLGGTALSPVLHGEVASRPFRYGGAVLDSAGGEIGYRDRMITGRFSGWRAGEAIVTGSGRVPADLALAPRAERLLDRPMDVRFRADSVPAGLVAFLAPGFTQVEGTVHGDLAVVGTPRQPELEGELRLVGGSAVFGALNVRYHRVDVLARMGKGSAVDIDGKVITRNGEADVRGSIDLQRPRDPAFDLDLVARSVDASHRRDVVAVTDGEIHLGGRYTRPVVTGNVRLVRGELDIDEVWRQYQIVQLDPSLFQLFDTTTVAYRPPPENPFLANVRLEALNVTAGRDVWVRSRELNVEVLGSLEVQLDRQADDLRMIGTLEARRGSYDLQFAQAPGIPARRFEIRDGVIEFVGTPGIDPNLDISAGYRVRRARGEPIDVLALVTGTLQNPRVSLTSDSDLPLSESDLASYILFGRGGAEQLSQAETDLLGSGLSLVRPAIAGFASSELQRMVSNVVSPLGLSIDYLAIRAPEPGLYGGSTLDRGAFGGMLDDAQVEVGVDLSRDVFVVGSYRLPAVGANAGPSESPGNRFGLRVEYRFLPTWTSEFYYEDRFARTPSFGLAEIDDRKVQGFSIFREWGY